MKHQLEQSSPVLSGFSCWVKQKGMNTYIMTAHCVARRAKLSSRRGPFLCFQRGKRKRETAFAATSSEGDVWCHCRHWQVGWQHSVYANSSCSGGVPEALPPPSLLSECLRWRDATPSSSISSSPLPPRPFSSSLKSARSNRAATVARRVCRLNMWSISALGGIILVAVIAERMVKRCGSVSLPTLWTLLPILGKKRKKKMN